LREGKIVSIEGNFYEEFERYVKKRPCKVPAVYIGALLGNLEGVRLLGLLRDEEKSVSFLGPRVH
jgi:hypothetical protein